MNTTVAARPARHARPTAPLLPEFESLDHAHRAALQMLQAFQQMVDRLEEYGTDDSARASAQRIMDFFNGPGRHHHADEEKHVFPGLLASADTELVQHVHRLQQDHGWMEEDWRELKPQVEAIAGGYNWYDLALLRQALPIFDALYRDHIALEESLIYPAARRQREALLRGRGEHSAAV